MNRDHATFCLIGSSLFGAHWRGDLAGSLHVAPRTVARWANGTYDIAPGIWDDLAKICANRGILLEHFARELRA